MSKADEMDKQDLNRLRNAIHNEAGVTKQEIREMVEKAVEHLVDKKVKQLIPDEVTMDAMVDKAIKSRSLYWLSKEEAFDDRVINEVARLLYKQVDLKLGLKNPKPRLLTKKSRSK
jgi:Ribonuclease G/E